MSVQPRRPLLESLRELFTKMEADPAPETANLADLKRIVRERIAAIEAAERIVVATPQPGHAPNGHRQPT
ncbi:hypothetical protein P8935_22965 [Telmatobacter sp. DSM 110680]|uniref:Uncharacterized protein n=1 Tax=Telmatobacter sp. DSM 110680 TaxID=3036704 RepID=A0AAU7DK01_9BACT